MVLNVGRPKGSKNKWPRIRPSLINGRKTCSECKELKPLAEFYVIKKTNYVRPACKECCAIQNSRVSANARRKYKYGITEMEYEELFAKQNYRCAICKKVPAAIGGHKKINGLHLDHCHRTKKVRGVLCYGCNVGLGNFRDDPQTLEAAAKYLRSQV